LLQPVISSPVEICAGRWAGQSLGLGQLFPEFHGWRGRPTRSTVATLLVGTLLNLAVGERDRCLPLEIVGKETTLQENESVLASMSQQPDTRVIEANLPEVTPS